jgi:outer membrane protein assembly factor BamB
VFEARAVSDGTLARKLIAFDVKSGKTHWEFETGARQRNHSKFLTNGDAYRDDIGTLLKSSSDVLRMYQALGGIFSTPVISDDKLVVSCYDGSVYCLRLH